MRPRKKQPDYRMRPISTESDTGPIYWRLRLLAILLFLIGGWAAFAGELPIAGTSSVVRFQGWERLITLIPVIMGWMLWLGSSPTKSSKNRLKHHEQK